MNLLLVGDVVGKSGVKCVARHLPHIKEILKIDITVVNGENAEQGFGLTPSICKQLYACGVDCITTGNHVWDKPEVIKYMSTDECIIRPANYPKNTPGQGHTIINTPKGSVLVMQVMGQVFMNPSCNCPFESIDNIINQFELGKQAKNIILEVHAETTAEKKAIALAYDGKTTVTVGSHTHVPTSDTTILQKGSAYQTDLGMCGCFDNCVIGFESEEIIFRFRNKRRKQYMQVSNKESAFCGLYVQSDDDSGLAVFTYPIIFGPGLISVYPRELSSYIHLLCA